MICTGPPYPSCSIYHNTLYGTRHGVEVGVGAVGGSEPLPRDVNWGGLQIRNNLFAFGTSYILNVWTKDLNRTPQSIGLNGNLYRLADDAPGMWQLEDWWANTPEVHRVVTQAPVESLFANADARDFSLAVGSPAIDAAPPLTHTAANGTGKELLVEEARYFVDGWDGLFEGDTIQVGANAPVPVAAVDYERNVITLREPLTWSAGDPVSLPWEGKAPDIGAVEQLP